jgi:hypothetical protein
VVEKRLKNQRPAPAEVAAAEYPSGYFEAAVTDS